MELELIITTNKNVYRKFCISGAVLFLVAAYLLASVPCWVSAGIVLTLLQIFLCICSVAAAVCFIYSLYRLLNTCPMAIVNQEGIWVKQFDLIPWSNIQELGAFAVQGNVQPNSLTIKVKDVEALSKGANLGGKFMLFESRIFGFSHVVIDNIEQDNSAIINFAQQFLEQHQEL